jgi:hypothetical protein
MNRAFEDRILAKIDRERKQAPRDETFHLLRDEAVQPWTRAVQWIKSDPTLTDQELKRELRKLYGEEDKVKLAKWVEIAREATA